MPNIAETLRAYTDATFTSLRVRNYRLYYLGQIISTSGTFMQSIAQDWLVLKLSNSGVALGGVTALQYLPILIFGPYGGLVADRFSKRKILYFTQTVAGLLALLLGFLVATNLVQLWMVYVIAFSLGVVTIFDMPARQTFVVELVGESDLKNAVTLYSTLVNLSRIIGPAVAGILIAGIGLALCFILNGLSYVAVIVMLVAIRPAELHIVPAAQRAKGQLAAGWRYVLSSPVLSTTLLIMAIIGTLTYEFQVTLPLLAKFQFNGDAGSYALLSAALGAGAVIGGLLVAGQRSVSHGQLVRSALLFGLAVTASAFMPSLWLSAVAMVLVGVCSIAFATMGNSLLQLESNPQMRGRVMAFWSVAVLGSSTIGGPIVGWTGQVFGARWGLALGGVAGVIAAGLGVWLHARAVAAEGAAPVSAQSAAASGALTESKSLPRQ
jgi:MFS family permease